MLVFGTPLNGSLGGFAVICLLGAISFGGLGLLVASRPKTVEAVSGWMNVVMLPMWLLSGVFFSSDNFPAAMQPFIRALPLTALNDALRANMIDGAGLCGAWPQLLDHDRLGPDPVRDRAAHLQVAVAAVGSRAERTDE